MSSPEAGPVLVVGGTGHFGRHIVRSLGEMGRAVRVLSRNEQSARKILGAHPEIVEGDVTSTDAVDRALQGVGRVLIALSALSPALIRKHKQIERDAVLMLLERARALRVRRIVYLCGYELRPEPIEAFDFAPGRIMLEVQTAIAASDFNWTVLGESPSMDIFFATIRGDKMYFPGGGPPAFPTVSALDVGQIAAQAVVRDDLAARRFRVTGPEALSFPKAATRISQITGKPLRFKAVPLLPLRIAATIARPFRPYFHMIVSSARFLNDFPQDLAERVPEDYAVLVRTFQYTPVTFDEEVRRWWEQQKA